jgi:hypothetical protein
MLAYELSSEDCWNRPVAAAEVPEAESLLGWQINHNETIGACLLCVLEHALLAVAQEGVVIAHEHDRRLEAALPCVTDHLQYILDVDAVLESLLDRDIVRNCSANVHVANDSTYSVRSLDRGTVGNGVGEGHAKLDDVCSCQLPAPVWFWQSIAHCTYQRHQPPFRA